MMTASEESGGATSTATAMDTQATAPAVSTSGLPPPGTYTGPPPPGAQQPPPPIFTGPPPPLSGPPPPGGLPALAPPTMHGLPPPTHPGIQPPLDAATPRSRTPPPLQPADLLPPQATLYVYNLPWSIPKPQLRRNLKSLFGRYGKILDVRTFRHSSLKGQAWILFDELRAATKALDKLQNFVYFGKHVRINYAKEKSDRVAIKEGVLSKDDAPKRKARRKVKKEERLKRLQEQKEQQQQEQQQEGQPPSSAEVGGGMPPSSVGDGPPVPGAGGAGYSGLPQGVVGDGTANMAPPTTATPGAVPPPTTTTTTTATTNSTSTQPPPSTTTSSPPKPPSPPSNLLIADELPSDCNEMMLAMLFRPYTGYHGVTITPKQGKHKNVATIEFDTEAQAGAALKALQGFKLTPKDCLRLRQHHHGEE